MTKLIENVRLPFDRDAILFSEDEDHGPLEVHLNEFNRELERIIFDMTQVINLNDSESNLSFSIQTDDYTLIQTEGVVLVDATEDEITLTLPSASLSLQNQFNIKKIDATNNKVIIDGDGFNIDGDSSFALELENEAVRIYSTGEAWFIL